MTQEQIAEIMSGIETNYQQHLAVIRAVVERGNASGFSPFLVAVLDMARELNEVGRREAIFEGLTAYYMAAEKARGGK